VLLRDKATYAPDRNVAAWRGAKSAAVAELGRVTFVDRRHRIIDRRVEQR
jgi:hypothetical protein